MNISLFAQPGRRESARALEQLRAAFPEANIRVINASDTMAEMYPCPFVQEEGTGGAFYGMSGIESFIRFRNSTGAWGSSFKDVETEDAGSPQQMGAGFVSSSI